MQFVVTLNGAQHTIETADAAVLAAIGGLRERFNQKAGLALLQTDAAYVQKMFGDWAARNVGFTQADLDAIVAQTFASWVNQFQAAELVTPELSGEPLKNALKTYAANKRYRVETGGMTVNGLAIPTDRETQSKLSGAVLTFQTGALSGAIDWKAAGGWVQLDQAAVTALASAVAAHVQAAFSRERAVSALIDDGTITTVAQIDAQPWS